MSESNNYVCFNVDQSENQSEQSKARARHNIGAAAASDVDAFNLKPLTLESVTVDTAQYALMVEDGKAYRFTMATSGYIGINTTSEETVHTVLSFRNDGTGCNTVNITWKDETLSQHDIQINLYGQPQGVEYMFDVYVRKVQISNVNYCIARVYDYPVAWRQGRQYGTDADANGLIGLYN